MFPMSAAQFVAIGCCVIALPLFIILTIFLYKHQHLIHYEKRGKKLIWGSHIQAMLLFGYMNIFTLLRNVDTTYNTMWPICMLMGCSTLEIFGAGRYCFQFVNIRKQQDLSEWKLHLNPQYKSQLFVMKHINLFGNNKTITFICCIFTLLLFAIYIIGFLLLPNGSYKTYTIIVGITTYFISGILNFFFTRFGKLFKFVDFWGISQQHKNGAISSMILVLFLFVIIWIDMAYETILVLSNSFCSFLLLCFISQNIIIPYKLYKEHEKQRALEQQINTGSKRKLKVLDTIRDNEGYVLFMTHLYKEFAAENLLYLTVLIQFEQFLIKHNFIDGENPSLLNGRHYVLPDCVPISEFFKYDQLSSDIQEKVAISFIAIYEKFIQPFRAEFEINISYELSNELLKCYARIKPNGSTNRTDFNVDVWSKLQLTAQQAFAYLTDSHQRFKYYAMQIRIQ